jgi:hypothetical protein
LQLRFPDLDRGLLSSCTQANINFLPATKSWKRYIHSSPAQDRAH